jgi:hypothetical protein
MWLLLLLRCAELHRAEHQGGDRRMHPHIELEAYGVHGAMLYISVRWPFYKWGYKTRGPVAIHAYNPTQVPNEH